MVSLALFLAAFGPLSTRYGFPSGNSSTASIDAPATVTPVSCEDVLFPPPHRAGSWTLGLWILSTPNAEETQSSFSLGFVDSRCGHVSPSVWFFRRTTRRRTVAAVSGACRAGLLTCATSGNARLLTPRWHMQLRVTDTAYLAVHASRLVCDQAH